MPKKKQTKRLKYMAADSDSGEELIIGRPYRQLRGGGFSLMTICRYNLTTGEAIGTMPPPPLHQARSICAVAETFLGIIIQVEQLRNKLKAAEAPTT